MNLTTDPWIPIVWGDGKPGIVSLSQAFAHGNEIQDLAVRPHERIGLMRLLICIAQAALDGPNDQDDWKSCRARIAPSALAYLDRWRHAFELFGDGQRFLQVPKLARPVGKTGSEDSQGSSTSKLDLSLATGNNTTLFDNGGGSGRAFTPAELALGLLTFQCFSPGGRIGVLVWGGEETLGKGSSEHAPCLAGGMLHTLLRANNLLDTLHRNLLSKSQAKRFLGSESWGRPVWECMPSGPSDAAAATSATRTYLGRLVPLARAIWLAEDCRSLLLANGLRYHPYPGWREPMATIITRKVQGQPVRAVLPISIEKAPWRELHALVVKAVDRNTNGGPAALQNVPSENAFDIWVGGLVADQAKPVEAAESVFHVPGPMLGQPGQVVYERGVRRSENSAFRLARAVSAYHRGLGDNLDRPEMRSRRQQIQANAAAQFWTDVERAVPRLLEVVAAPQILGLQAEWEKTPWGRATWVAARAAYERACPHATPRQIRAYALGLRELFSMAPERPEPEAVEETEA